MKNTTHFRVKRQNIFWLNHVEPPICLLIGAQHYWPIKTPNTATLIEKRRCLGVSTKLSDPFFVIFVSLWVPWYFGHHELMISCHVGEIPMSHTSHVRPCKPSCRTETNPSAESAIDWMWHLESLRLSLRYNLKYVGISYTILSTYLWLANHMTIFHITIQNHNVSWVNHRSKWLCSSSQSLQFPEGIFLIYYIPLLKKSPFLDIFPVKWPFFHSNWWPFPMIFPPVGRLR